MSVLKVLALSMCIIVPTLASAEGGGDRLIEANAKFREAHQDKNMGSTSSDERKGQEVKC